MTRLRAVSALWIASILVLGCSKDRQDEETSLSKAQATDGSEVEQSQGAGRAREPSPELSAAKEAGEAKGAPLEHEAPQNQAADGSLNDGQILQITDLVNQGEIDQAQLAKSKATRNDVKEFAAGMIADHGKAKQAGAKLLAQEQIRMEDSPVATELKSESTRALEALRSAPPGAAFDKEYIDGQVKAHQKVLSLLESRLIPNANAEPLEAELEKTRGMVERHLRHAQKIEQALINQTP
jgi:putative membrane protein